MQLEAGQTQTSKKGNWGQEGRGAGGVANQTTAYKRSSFAFRAKVPRQLIHPMVCAS